jgi:IS30 family transposase
VDGLTQKELSVIENIMNNTPRKILGYLTPNEAYERIVTGIDTS